MTNYDPMPCIDDRKLLAAANALASFTASVSKQCGYGATWNSDAGEASPGATGSTLGGN